MLFKLSLLTFRGICFVSLWSFILFIASLSQKAMGQKLPELGSHFTPQDVDFDHPTYSTEFDDATILNDWVMEGANTAEIKDGNLILKDNPSTAGLVFWLKKEIPPDFLLEFTFCPQKRKDGLAIVFFNAHGKNGQSVFDPTLAPRDGSFSQYRFADLYSYHVSYWSGSTRSQRKNAPPDTPPSSHIRKNINGTSDIMAEGNDLVVAGKEGSFQTIRIYKQGGNILMMVDDVVAITYTDDGKSHGPIFQNSGWVGLRQMTHTIEAKYGRLAVYPLLDKPNQHSQSALN
jgi:hypothetical protein